VRTRVTFGKLDVPEEKLEQRELRKRPKCHRGREATCPQVRSLRRTRLRYGPRNDADWRLKVTWPPRSGCFLRGSPPAAAAVSRECQHSSLLKVGPGPGGLGLRPVVYCR
jgi:hypothetical protein